MFAGLPLVREVCCRCSDEKEACEAEGREGRTGDGTLAWTPVQPPWALSMYRYGQAAFGVSATQGDRRGRPAEGGQSHQIAMTNAGRGGP